MGSASQLSLIAAPRPLQVAVLMRLLSDFVATDCEELCANGVRLLVSGDTERLPPPALQRPRAARRHLAARAADLTLCIALSYGGREEIAAAAAAAAAAVAAGALPAAAVADPSVFRRFLRTRGCCRTRNCCCARRGSCGCPTSSCGRCEEGGGGVPEMHRVRQATPLPPLQIAYSELYVTPVLWPDFYGPALVDALRAYAGASGGSGRLATR